MQNTDLTRAFLKYRCELIKYLTAQSKCATTAKDLCQEIYLRVLRVEDPSSIRNVRSYLFKIASNLLKDHMRKESRRAELINEAGDLLSEQAEWRVPEDFVLAREEIAHLARVLSSLPAISRQIFYCHRFENMTRAKIAQKFGISISSVENHIQRVLDRLIEEREQADNDK